jgi:hypothetical protein
LSFVSLGQHLAVSAVLRTGLSILCAVSRTGVVYWTAPRRRLPCVTVTDLPTAAGVDASDSLAPLLELADVRTALQDARAAVDDAFGEPALRRSGGAVAAEVSLRSAVASAALEGHGYELEAVRAGAVTDPVVQGALRVAREAEAMAGLWLKVPRQVLARVHVLAGRDVVDDGTLGRPVSADVVPRLSDLVSLVAGPSTVPVLLLAAVVHGELLALRPFAGPSGVVARAAARLTLIAGGLDPRGLLAPEVGHLARQPEYVGAANAFATGTRDGLRAWIRHYATAVELAAGELRSITEAA